MGKGKKDITPLLMHWSYAFLELTYWKDTTHHIPLLQVHYGVSLRVHSTSHELYRCFAFVVFFVWCSLIFAQILQINLMGTEVMIGS